MPVQLLLAEPTDDDALLVMRWRNDPTTLAASFHQEPKVWPAFQAEFARYFDASIPPLFGADDGERLAFVRFRDVVKPALGPRLVVDISINVAPEARGRGVGTRIIALASARALEQADAVLAEIRPGNAASVKAFLAAGYSRIENGTHEVEGVAVAVERFVLRREGARDER